MGYAVKLLNTQFDQAGTFVEANNFLQLDKRGIGVVVKASWAFAKKNLVTFGLAGFSKNRDENRSAPALFTVAGVDLSTAAGALTALYFWRFFQHSLHILSQ
jgi:hypothetical protein